MASRFWVGGTGTVDLVTTTHWASSSGGAGGASVPGASDNATFDASSGGGTVTWASGTFSYTLLTTKAFTGTIEMSANNPTVNLSGSTGWDNSGSGVRTINLGSSVINLTTTSANTTVWAWGTATNLTFSGASSTINLTGASGYGRAFAGGAQTYGTVTFAGGSGVVPSYSIAGLNTFGTLTLNAPQAMSLLVNQVATNFNISGTSSSALVAFVSPNIGTAHSISVASGTLAFSWLALMDMTFTGGATFSATSSLDLGNNTGITITAPSFGGGLVTNRGMAGGMNG